MDSDRISGAGREFGGKVQQRIGEWTGDAGTQAQGLADQAAGAARNVYGQAKDAVRHAADEVSDRAAEAYDRSRHAAWEGHQASVAWPHASLILAGLVGFGLGFLVSRL